MISPETSLESLPKVNKRVFPALKKLGIKTVRDLLFHLPTRYEDFSNKVEIRNAQLSEVVTVQGVVRKIEALTTMRKRMVVVQAMVEDETGKIRATWFNQPFLARNLKAGDRVSLSGKIALGPKGKYLQNPAYEKLSIINNQLSIHTGGLVAVYPETRGITSRWLRFLIKNFIDARGGISDSLPPETRRRYQLPEVSEALLSIHFPKTGAEALKAKRRFSFESLLLIQLRVLKDRINLKSLAAPAIPLNIALVKKFVSSLPYDLTNAQRRSIWEILQDISKPRPMNRLLEGDVGSGKTIVAAASALLAVRAGYKVLFMAPTEILAKQHFETLKKFLAPFDVAIDILTASEKTAGKSSEIIIGTHALIQKHVQFQNLGLVVVDEQHRFGVGQRAQLQKQESLAPHFLSMSATPIPRTLALTIYSDLDLSILDEMPKSRKEVITRIIEPGKRAEAYQFIRKEVSRGYQAFVICPRIEKSTNSESDTNLRISEDITGSLGRNENKTFISPSLPVISESRLQLWEMKAVKEEYKKLSEEIFPDLRVAMLHGKMKASEKDSVMKKFSAKGGSASGGKNHEIDVLVSTSVVEVGVDIPNATIMMIEGAERFGLAQLHQFRGRVGRGADQSYCLLFATEGGMAAKRLRAVVDAKTGFELAEIDLEIRGPGDIFGIRQSGISSILAAALADSKLVRDVRREAVEILKKDQELSSYPELRRRVEEIARTVHFE